MSYSWVHDTIPCAAVVIDSSQTLMAANSQAIDLLCLEADEIESIRLSSLFTDKGLKPESTSQMLANEHLDLSEPYLVVLRSRKYVRCLTSRIPDSEEQPSELTLCLFIEIGRDERLQLLFRELPVGLYELDSGSRVIAVNKAILEMFGYGSEDEMIGRPATDFYVHQEDEKRVAAEAAGMLGISGEIIQFIRADGKEFFGRLYARQVESKGRVLGRDGAIINVTEEERHRRILKDAPLGFYTVGRNEEGEEVITECNEAFATMFDFEKPSDVSNIRVATLYDSADDYERFRKLLEERDRNGEPLIGEPLKVRSLANRRFTIDVYCRALHSSPAGGPIIGRIGLARKTDEYEMQGLIKDIGRILHPYTGVLQMMQHTLSSVEETLIDTMDAKVSPSGRAQQMMAMDRQVNRLQENLQMVLNLRTGDRADAFPGAVWDKIGLHKKQLIEYKEEIPFPELYPSALRALAFSISQIVRTADKGIPRELLRLTRENARLLQVVATRAEIQTTRALVAEAGHQALTLREYIISRATPPARQTVESLDDLLRRAIEQNSGFAADQGVSIQRGEVYNDVRVRVARSSVVRAFSNLLHNAIKYSWERKQGSKRWVEIRCFVKGEEAIVEFENFGVLIPADEIQTGSIFVIGHRGRLSYETGRLGSGIGLADALAIAKDHCGDIKIESISVSDGAYEGRIGAKTTVSFHMHI